MTKGITGLLAVLVAIALVVTYGALFTVHQNQQALVLRLGEPVKILTEPGLQFKYPLVDSVVYIDKRILDLENPAQEVIASDQKRLVVDAFARYKIFDPLKFYQSLGTVEGANSRLTSILNSSLRRVLGEATFIQVVRDERELLMSRIRDVVRKTTQREAAKQFGVSQPRLNDVMRGKISNFSLDALVNMLGHAGMRVEMKVKRAA